MRRFTLTAFALLVALGCSRKEPPQPDAGPPNVVPPVVIAPPAPPDDGIPPPRLVPVRTRMQALALGIDYLLAQQSKDGAWRSDVLATFKDGTALTPLVVTALQDAHDAGVRNAAVEAAIRKGCEWLAKFVKDGAVVAPADGFDYPVYTAALTLKALLHSTVKEDVKARDAWVKYIKERQLTEKLGWKPEDKEYGGWGYCRAIPKKPKPGEFAPPLIESNLSATVFALDALAASNNLGEVFQAAGLFVRRCQNEDGGFHFIYDDPVRNKAGAAAGGSFHSYGSMTADGLHALALCGDPADKDRRDAARDWLLKNFRADHHPGEYIKTHESTRDAVYYYYAASAARAFRDHKLALRDGRDWSAELSYELAKRQAKDGSWANRIDLVRENDPIVATGSAVLALARCK